MTEEERDDLLLRLDAGLSALYEKVDELQGGQVALRSGLDALEEALGDLQTGQGELLIYVKEMAKRLLSPAEISEIETGIAIALAVIQEPD